VINRTGVKLSFKNQNGGAGLFILLVILIFCVCVNCDTSLKNEQEIDKLKKELRGKNNGISVMRDTFFKES